MAATSSANAPPDFAPPLPLMDGFVRNASEAAALVRLDYESIKYEVLHDHLLGCCAHERELMRLHSVLALATGGTPLHAYEADAASADATATARLRAALVLCEQALAATRRSIDRIVVDIDELVKQVDQSATTLRRYAESNEAFVREIQEAGTDAAPPALASTKQQLWLVEESLVARVDATLAALRARLPS